MAAMSERLGEMGKRKRDRDTIVLSVPHEMNGNMFAYNTVRIGVELYYSKILHLVRMSQFGFQL